MNYVIVSPSKKVYIRLNDKGSPETCAKQAAQHFENSKARNIVDHLPKTLRKLNFKVEPVPDILSQEKKDIIDVVKKGVIYRNDYEVSENISRWIDRFGACYDTLDEAKKIFGSLVIELEDIDKELLDLLHCIELESPKDLYKGWKLYKTIRENRRKRRTVKDEIMIIKNVLERIDPSCLKREQVQKAIDGLFGRKYSFRIIEEESENVV